MTWFDRAIGCVLTLCVLTTAVAGAVGAVRWACGPYACSCSTARPCPGGAPCSR